MKKFLRTVLCLYSLISMSHAQEGDTMNLEVTTGLQGSFSFAQVGVNLPQFIEHFVIGIKYRAMSSLTWATFKDLNTGTTVSFHPIVMGTVLSFGGTGTMVDHLFRSYGNIELLVGETTTPYDSAIYGVGNLVGANTTYGIFATYGLEFFTSDTVTIFIESGGGIKTMTGDKNNQYLIASSWLGSGVTFRMGTKIYF